MTSACAPRTSRMAYCTLAIVALIGVVKFVGRQIIEILLPSVKMEFRLSDFELGIIAGPAFAVVYSIRRVVLAGGTHHGG